MKQAYNRARMWSFIGLGIIAIYGAGKYYVENLKAKGDSNNIKASRKPMYTKSIHTMCKFNFIVLNDSFFHNPSLDDKPLDLGSKNLILLDTEDINRELIIKPSDTGCPLSIISLLDNKALHTFKAINAQQIMLSDFLLAFFKTVTYKPKLYIIKDLYSLYNNKLIHLESVAIECCSTGGIILAMHPKTKQAYKAKWNASTHTLSQWSKIDRQEKDIEQNKLLRDYIGVRPNRS